MKLIYTIFILIISTSYLIAKDKYLLEKSSFGIYLSNINTFNQVNFLELSEIKSCCPDKFSNNYSNNFNIGVNYRNFYNYGFAYFLDLSLINYQENFSSVEKRNTIDGIADVKHSLDLNMYNLQTRFGFSNLYKNLSFSYGVISEFALSKKFNQKEEMISPLGATFENDERVRNIFKNENAEYINIFNYGVFTQIWYNYHINNKRTKSISPFIEANYFISNYHKNGTFRKFNIHFGISFRWINLRELESPITPKRF